MHSFHIIPMLILLPHFSNCSDLSVTYSHIGAVTFFYGSTAGYTQLPDKGHSITIRTRSYTLPDDNNSMIQMIVLQYIHQDL